MTHPGSQDGTNDTLHNVHNLDMFAMSWLNTGRLFTQWVANCPDLLLKKKKTAGMTLLPGSVTG